MQAYSWTWDKHPVAIAYDTIGSGDRVLLLPALSTYSPETDCCDRRDRPFNVSRGQS